MYANSECLDFCWSYLKEKREPDMLIYQNSQKDLEVDKKFPLNCHVSCVKLHGIFQFLFLLFSSVD